MIQISRITCVYILILSSFFLASLAEISGIRSPNLHHHPGEDGRFRHHHRRDQEAPASDIDDDNNSKQQQQDHIQQYVLWKSDEIRDALVKWAIHYPDMVRVTTAQQAFGLPAAGGPNDCPFDREQVIDDSTGKTSDSGCLNYILTIQDYVAHPEGSESSSRLPEVLWSGELHGDERVGPTAVMEAAQLLLEAASCEANPKVGLKQGNSDAYKEELGNALSCRQDLERRYGFIGNGDRQWLARIVSTRRIVVVPTANALGYFQKIRTEYDIDPNRDFPYDLKDPTQCMQTIAGRTLNEVFRQHMFQLSLTFHGGMEVIGYEWGAPSWKNPKSPDDTAQKEIAAAYSHFGGGFQYSQPYQFGNMNEFVYPVRGGMEDWAYAASWDTERVIQCAPNQFGGYPAEQTTYDPGTLRVFNMLVESSDDKTPIKSDLGTSQNLLQYNSKGTGYVSRNIRLSLLAANLVQPYVSMREVNELQLSDDVIPLSAEPGGEDASVSEHRTYCQTTRAVSVPANSRKVILQWKVGGAITIDNTTLWYAKWDDIPTEITLECGTTRQPTLDDVKEYMKQGTPIGDTSGIGPFAASSNTEGSPSPPFAASMDISQFAENDKIIVIASARVDQAWGTTQTDSVPENVAPQSHIVNARTNADWHYESAGKVIEGRLDWFSVPLTIVLRKPSDVVEAIELSNRFPAGGDEDEGETNTENIEPAKVPEDDDRVPPSGTSTTTNGEDTKQDAATPETTKQLSLSERVGYVIVLFVIVAAVLLAGRAYLRHRMRVAQRLRVRDFIEDQDAPSPGLRKNGSNGSSNQQYRNKGGYADIPANSELEMGEYS